MKTVPDGFRLFKKVIMKKFLIAALAALSVSAYATPGGEPNNTGCNGKGNINSPCGGQGGAGGAGGHGGAGGTGIGVGLGGSASAGASANAAAIQGQAQSTNVRNSVSNSNSNQAMGGNSYASSGGNVITTTQEGARVNVQVEGAKGDVTYYQAQERNPVATAYAAPLSSAPETCMGSSSGGAQGANFGVSFGTTWQSASCERRMNARALQSTGNSLAAIALLCQDSSIRQAMEDAGAACPSKSRQGSALDANSVAGSPSVQPAQSKVDVSYTDPIIRSRLGLPPLK